MTQPGSGRAHLSSGCQHNTMQPGVDPLADVAKRPSPIYARIVVRIIHRKGLGDACEFGRGFA